MMMADGQEKIHHHHHHHHRRRRSFIFHMPHFGHDQEAAGSGMPPKGMMGLRVGYEGEEQQRFVVPVEQINHPLFAELLEEAEKEYGFEQKGAIVIPCDVQHFLQVQQSIDRENSAADHHHRHRHLPCFGLDG